MKTSVCKLFNIVTMDTVHMCDKQMQNAESLCTLWAGCTALGAILVLCPQPLLELLLCPSLSLILLCLFECRLFLLAKELRWYVRHTHTNLQLQAF